MKHVLYADIDVVFLLPNALSVGYCQMCQIWLPTACLDAPTLVQTATLLQVEEYQCVQRSTWDMLADC
jgi:hypothetical protein